MKRRDFLKLSGGMIAASLAPQAVASRPTGTLDRTRLAAPRPSEAQLRWQDCEIGVIYHFDLPIAAGIFASNNMFRKTIDPTLYQPKKLDTDQWLEAAKAAGATYALFTATHFSGFMQWQTDLYPYGLRQTTWRNGQADVVGDFVGSCRRAGIRPGIYCSLHRNVYWNLWGHYVDWGKGRGSKKQKAFNRIGEKMTEELCSRYGPLVQIWYDAGVKTPEEGGPDVLPVFEKHQPNSVFYHSKYRSDHRWVGNEDGYANYPCWATMPDSREGVSHNSAGWRAFLGSGDPNGKIWSPAMVDVPLRGAENVHNWFWAPGQDHAAHSTEALVEMYYKSVGRNSNFVIGEVVTPEGLVPESDVKRLKEFGREIRRRFNRPVAETSGRGELVELRFPQARRIDHVMAMEDIAHGELIREYSIEGLVNGDKWERLGEGRCVGHKRIQKIARREVAAVRVRVMDALATPRLRQLAVFDSSAH